MNINSYSSFRPCKKLLVFLVILVGLCSNNQLWSQVRFDEFFISKSLRIDLVFAGDESGTEVVLQDIRTEPHWGGNPGQLIDPFGYGDHQLRVLDQATGQLIYSRGFSTLYSEWLTTDEATRLSRGYPHVLISPFPKNKVIIELMKRHNDGSFVKEYELEVDPSSIFIKEEPQPPVKVSEILINGPASEKVDFVFVAEGYKQDEMDKFLADVKRFTDFLFAHKPFSSYKSAFNVRAVESGSLDSGTDIPGQGVWRRTACHSSFYTFGIERYLTTTDYHTVCDYAGHAPYDLIFVLVNSAKYGGGGMYNLYSMGTADHQFSEEVFIHELGHGFAGLGDEYFDSDVAYNDFYKLHLEPWEPNLTTLVDFSSKWEDMLEDSIPVPTPPDPQFIGVSGVYEGGGYVSKGVYRPSIDCIMHHAALTEEFCAVCRRSIERMINYYTQGQKD